MIETKIDIDTLKDELDADPANNFICVSECLGATEINASMDAARAAVTSEPPANPSTVLTGPYKDIGPYFKVDAYPDDNPTDNAQTIAQEPTMPAEDITGMVVLYLQMLASIQLKKIRESFTLMMVAET